MHAPLREMVDRIKALTEGREHTDGPRLLGEFAESLRQALTEIEAARTAAFARNVAYWDERWETTIGARP